MRRQLYFVCSIIVHVHVHVRGQALQKTRRTFGSGKDRSAAGRAARLSKASSISCHGQSPPMPWTIPETVRTVFCVRGAQGEAAAMLAGRPAARPLSSAIYGAAAVRRASVARLASAKRPREPPQSAGAQRPNKSPKPVLSHGARSHAGLSAVRRKCPDSSASIPGDELSTPGRTRVLPRTASQTAPPKCAPWGGGGGRRALNAALDAGRSNPQTGPMSSRGSGRGQVGRSASEPDRRRGASAPARRSDPEPNPNSRAGSIASATQLRAIGGHGGARSQRGEPASPGPRAGGRRDSPSCGGNVSTGDGPAAGEGFARFLARQQACEQARPHSPFNTSGIMQQGCLKQQLLFQTWLSTLQEKIRTLGSRHAQCLPVSVAAI